MGWDVAQVVECLPRSQAQWLMPVIPAMQETDIRRMEVQGQPTKKVNEILISINKPSVVVHVYNPSYKDSIGRSNIV
jgi:hypothetical protein